MANQCPVVLVHGLFGWGPGELAEMPYWGKAMAVRSPLPRLMASVGAISSLHDRACELAFNIRGGQVDYGHEHAGEAGHSQHGKTYPSGLYPEWSEQHPVHLVGHSMGAPTIRLLQQLLAEDYFGWGSNHRWVASINSISGVLNGSTATYFFGCDEETGLLDEDTAADFLGHAIELFLRATGGLFDGVYDFDLDQWGLGGMRDDESLAGYLRRIAHSPMFSGKDNGAYSLTVQSALDQNARCLTHQDTFYFSYVTEQTVNGVLSERCYPEPAMNPFLIASSLYIGGQGFSAFYPGFRSEEWWPNDGLVSTFSQQRPRIAGEHPDHGEMHNTVGFKPGGWYHHKVKDMDHIDIVALPQLNQIGRQKRFYHDLFERLSRLDINRATV